jgi:hypothetical protein
MMVGNRKIMLVSLLSLATIILVLLLMSLESQAAEILIDGIPGRDIATGEPRPLSDPTTYTVTKTTDDGSSGTLRRCLSEVKAGDTIVFDTDFFSSPSPATITITSGFLLIDKDNITIDGSGAGVIIDGSQLTSVYDDGFRIASDNNIIRGITIQNFPGDGVDIRDGAQGNRIENCIIRGNGRGGTGRRGVRVDGNGTTGNTITKNSITDNDGPGIVTTNGGNAELAPPIINSVISSTDTITITGFALPGVTVELFRDRGGEGATFLGDVKADSYGNFTFTGTLTTPLGGDNVTATATYASGNTSMFTCYPIPIPNLVWPISGTTTFDGPFSSPFGPRFKASDDRYDWHRGLDIPVPTGTLAYAVADGTVRCAGKCPGYSDPIIVQLEHEDGCYYCNYLHMLTNTVETGYLVTQGITVGLTGGTESLDHLHFEIRRGGYYQRNAINPFVYLPYTDTLGHTAIISGVYVHTASMTPTVTARVVVTALANELDFNRLALTVTDGTEELDWRAADLHVFNIQKSTIEHPEVLDNPYVDDICIMPAPFNKTSGEYRIDFVFYGLEGDNSVTLTAEAADVHSNVRSTTTSKMAGGVTISPTQVISSTWPGTTITYTHILSNGSGITPTLKLNATSAQSWTVQVSPSSITLLPYQQSEIKVSLTVPTSTCGITDCIAVTAADTTGTIQVIGVDVTSVPCPSFLPVIMKNYP